MKNKTHINKKISLPDLKRIIIISAYSAALAAVVFAAWYYFAVTVPEQEVNAKNQRFETMLGTYKAKYCNNLPYKSAAVKRLCTQNPFPSK